MWMYIFPVILVWCLGVQGTDYFDCGRPGQDCANGKCTKDVCVCDPEYEGYNCKLKKLDKDVDPCATPTDSCGDDGGLCYKNGVNKACFCPANLYGDSCGKTRYDVDCMAESMKITVFPAGEFNGKIYLKDQENAEGCDFTYVSGTSGPREREVDDTKCGGVTTDKATGAKSRVVIIQYSSKYITNLDTKLTVTCHAGSGTIEVTKTFTSEDADGNTKEQNIENTFASDSSVVKFDIKLKDGTSISKAVPLDEKLTLQFEGTKCDVKDYMNKIYSGSETEYNGNRVGNHSECRKLCEEDPRCMSATYGDRYCVTFAATLDETDFKISYMDHYKKICEKDPCSFTKLVMKRIPARLGNENNQHKTLDQCRTACLDDIKCKSFNFGASGDTTECYTFTDDVEDQIMDTPVQSILNRLCPAVRVESCTATNGLEGEKESTVKLIEDKCRSNDAGKLVPAEPTKKSILMETFEMSAFKFNDNNAISVTCSVKYCPIGSVDDCKLSCGGGRRKRSAEISAETVRRTFYIMETQRETPRTSDSNSSEEASAMAVDVMTPTLAGVGVVLFLMLVICITVLLIVVKRRSSRNVKEDTKKQII